MEHTYTTHTHTIKWLCTSGMWGMFCPRKGAVVCSCIYFSCFVHQRSLFVLVEVVQVSEIGTLYLIALAAGGIIKVGGQRILCPQVNPV